MLRKEDILMIEALVKRGVYHCDIAADLEVAPKTLSRALAPIVRLWTSLQDPRTAPALDLAQLYAQRWEHELYVRDVTRQLRKSAVLQSHTVDTGAQEIAAVVLASAVLAAERATTAGDHLAALRISFTKLLQVVQAMWFTVAFGDGILTERQMQTMMKQLQSGKGRGLMGLFR